MKVYGLSGKSGTGKSYNATELCGRMKIPAIIDDGLFICDANIVAGKSAKKQAQKMTAVKTALFSEDSHRDAVIKAIDDVDPSAILVLGTSDAMVDKIAERLCLPKPEQYIHIEDITTAEQREKAKHSRNDSGMHVIPAPTFQVKKQFSGFFVDAKKSFSNKSEKDIEKTVVRPTYSYLGDYTISNKVITDIAEHFASIIPGIEDVIFCTVNNSDKGMYIRVILSMKKNAQVMTAASDMQTGIYNAVSMMTEFNILGVGIEVREFA